jgi:subtilisin family serine protease
MVAACTVDTSEAGQTMRAATRATTRSAARRPAVVALGLLTALGLSTLTAPAAVAAPEPRTRVIVELKPGSDALSESRKAAGGGEGAISHVYRHAVNGFAGELSNRAIALLRRSPAVVSVEADGEVTASGTQTGATWGLDRIDQTPRRLNATFNYPDRAGTGVTAYIVDSGIAAHSEFGPRLTSGFTAITDNVGTGDCNGHGTHVAGTVAGTKYGVAKQATLVPVRVLDCNGSGSWSGVIAGLDWIVEDHEGLPAVANLSLGGGISSTVDAAVKRVIDDGVTVAVAAGNSNTNACNASPARVPEALTTGATEKTDRRASFSNYGSCLDLFAPGAAITSAWHTTGTATNTISGTSMAAPHVAGAAALLLSKTPSLTPADVATTLTSTATPGMVTSAGSLSPNRLLYANPANLAQ